MELYINAFAHYLPSGRVPNSYFKEVNGLDDEWISSRTGIRNRSKALDDENTNTMAVEAVCALQPHLPFPIEEVDLIVAATYSPYDTVRTAAHTVQRAFNIPDAKCLSVSSACSSFINALEIAEGYFGVKGIHEINDTYHVHLPITNAVYNILYEHISPSVEIRLLTEELR